MDVFALKQDLMAEQDCQYLFELDGNQQPDDLFAVSKLCTNLINLHQKITSQFCGFSLLRCWQHFKLYIKFIWLLLENMTFEMLALVALLKQL